ncbi:MAG: RimK family alpha-L-glutamate ligase [Candidatus Hydrothermarchaeota archaeon]
MHILIAGDKNRYSNRLIATSLEKRGCEVDFFNSEDISVTSEGNIGFKKISDLIYVRTGFFRDIKNFSKFLLHTWILELLENMGIKVINSLESFENTANKIKCLTLLEKNGINVPFSSVAISYEKAEEISEEMGFPLVLKPLFGERGEDIYLANSYLELQEYFDKINSKGIPVLLQEYLPKNYNRDIRVFVVGKEAVAAMYRYGKNDWRTNLSLGGIGKLCPLSDDIVDLSIKASEITKSDIVGVDILEHGEDLYVIEVNPLPGLLIQKVTGINVADKIAEYLIKKAKS